VGRLVSLRNLVKKRDHVVAAERALPRLHLEQERSERVEIGTIASRLIPATGTAFPQNRPLSSGPVRVGVSPPGYRVMSTFSMVIAEICQAVFSANVCLKKSCKQM
jgi:hypothetical protein